MDVINPHRFSTAAPAVDFDGFGNASRYFDGVSDSIIIGDVLDSTVFTAGSFTLACWAKRSTDGVIQFLFDKSGSSGNTPAENQRQFYMAFRTSAEGNRLAFGWWGTLGTSAYRVHRTTQSILASDGWVHCAVTYDHTAATNDRVIIYINGVADTELWVQGGTPTQIQDGTAMLSLGGSHGSTQQNPPLFPLHGNIADARIYDTNLSSTDIAALYGGENITTNLVGHWLKDTPSLLDHSGTNDGTNEGSAFAYDNPSPAVEFGKASRVFDDTALNYIETANIVSIGTGSMSWSAWAKAPNTSTGTYPDTIGRVGDNGGAAGGNSPYDGLHLLFYQNKLTVYFADFTNYGGAFIYQTSYTYNANQWYHLCGVLNASTQKLELYVDGVLDGSVDISAAYPWNLTATRPPSIGARKIGTSYGQYFNGQIADVRLYDDALSSTDALALYNGANVETNLIGHWLTNTDDVKDYAGVNDGTNNGSTYSFDNPLSEGEFGSASRDFVGGDYVDLSNSTDFDLTSTLTMSFWINPDNAHNGGIFGKWTTGAGTNNSYSCYFGQDSSNQRVSFILQQSTAPRIRLDSDIDLPLGQWSHVCCVADGTNMRIYINGVLNVSTTYDGTIKTTTKKLIIGRLREEDALYPFNGRIADVRLYDTGLLAQDVFDLSRGDDLRTNLVGQWLTNKDDVDDYAGTNHGTNNGSTYSQDAPL